MKTSLDALRGAAVVAAACTLVGCGAGLEDPDAPAGPARDAGPAPPPVAVVVDAGLPQPATSGPCDPVQSSALTAQLQARAATEAPGMQPFGELLCGNVAEAGEVAAADITLESGYCYTVLGEALPPVVELDMRLDVDLAASAPALPILGALARQPLMVDTMQGLHSGMGTQKSCYAWTMVVPVQAKVVAKSSKGGPGPVAAQAYRRKK